MCSASLQGTRIGDACVHLDIDLTPKASHLRYIDMHISNTEIKA